MVYVLDDNPRQQQKPDPTCEDQAKLAASLQDLKLCESEPDSAALIGQAIDRSAAVGPTLGGRSSTHWSTAGCAT
jgi:hypothetical protein